MARAVPCLLCVGMNAQELANFQPDVKDDDVWLLQSDAAAIAGCSVSAIRKWRRIGVIRDRTLATPGGMRRVEVRLGDVVARMRQSMPRHRVDEHQLPLTEPTPASVAVVPVPDLDVFVQHIAEAERRAAHAEAVAQANGDTVQFLRERVAELESELEAVQNAPGPGVPSGGPSLDASLIVDEIRDLRRRLQSIRRSGVAQDARQRISARLSHDAAVLCLSRGLGIPMRARLGDALTPAERTRLIQALSHAGIDLDA